MCHKDLVIIIITTTTTTIIIIIIIIVIIIIIIIIIIKEGFGCNVHVALDSKYIVCIGCNIQGLTITS